MIRIILVCILLVILLVACGPESQSGQVKEVAPNLYLTEIDGMPCVIYQGYKSGGLTCDWTRYTGAK